MTRLDEIERKAQFLSERRECKVWHFEIADVAALVAVARAAAQGPCRHDSSRLGESCPLCAALAPLRAERGEGSGQ